MKRLLSALLAALMLLSLCGGCAKPQAPTTTQPPVTTTATTVPPTTAPVGYEGATVILYTANVRGDVAVYSAISAAKANYEAQGATVYLVDAGNYLLGSAYANGDMGLTVYQLMEAVGYHVAGLGVYDLAYGEAELGYAAHGDLVKYYTQAQLYRGSKELSYQQNAPWAREPVMATRPAKAAAAFRVICSNLEKTEAATGFYDYDANAVLGEKLKVGFVSSLPEDAAQQLGDGFLAGYRYTDITAPKCDVLVALGGGQGDIVIDLPADGGLAVGAYVIYPKTGAIELEAVDMTQTDPEIDMLIAALEKPEVVGTLAHSLSGAYLSACNGMSGVGMLASNALKWYAETILEGIEYPVIGLFNGGNCRNFLYDGEITMADLHNAVHGFAEGIGVVYLTGAQILEMLEAATQRGNCPGWAYVTLNYGVALNTYYDAGAAYGLYYKAASINRVSITQEGFDLTATYAVVADQLLLQGADTYYLLKDQPQVLTDSTCVADIMAMYIRQAMGGHVGA